MKKLKLFSLLMLLFVGVTSMWAETITLTESNVRSQTSYSTTEQTFTNGVQFGYINLMTNNSNGTPTGWAKNQVMQTKNSGYLYNKAAISTIKHVKVWIVVNDNALSVGYGTTEKPTTNTIAKASATSGSESITYTKYENKTTTPGQTTTATTYDFDLSSYNATYFTIIPGGSTYIWKVEITYEAASSEPTLYFKQGENDITEIDLGNVGKSFAKSTTFSLSGENLTKDADLTLAASAGFTVSPTSIKVSAAGDLAAQTITVSKNTTTVGSITDGTLTISSDDFDDPYELTLKMDVKAPTFSVKTGDLAFGTVLQYVDHPTKTITLKGQYVKDQVAVGTASAVYSAVPTRIDPDANGEFEEEVTVTAATEWSGALNSYLTIQSTTSEFADLDEFEAITMTVTPRYEIAKSITGTGTVTWTVEDDNAASPQYALAGKTVSVEATAGEGYEFTSLAISENVSEPTVVDNLAEFTMPASDVTITAVFTESEDPYLTVSTDEIDFGEISYKGALDAESFTIEGANLEGSVVSIALVGNGETDEAKAANAAAFSIDEDELAITSKAVNGTITVTPRRNVCGSFSAKLVISTTGISPDKEVALSLTVNKLAANLAWSANETTAIIGEEKDDYPTLTNPRKLPVVYSSFDEDVATVNTTTGAITELKKAGETLIIANFAGNDTVAGITEDDLYYTLTVQEKKTANWWVNGTKVDSQTDLAGTALKTFPSDFSDFTDCADLTFQGWLTAPLAEASATAPVGLITETEGLKMPEGGVNYYAVFATKSVGKDVKKTDNIDLTFTGVSGTTYTAWSESKTGTSGAVYIGVNAGGNEAVQFRSDVSNTKPASGIISTASAGKVSKVTITWNSNTASGRTLDVFGSNTAYTAVADLVDDNKKGAFIGTIVKGTSTELTIPDSAFIGLRSNSGAMYIDNIAIEWTVPGATTYSGYLTTCPSCNAVTFVKAGEDNGNTFALKVAGKAVESVKTCDDVSVNVVAAPATGYEMSGFEVSGIDGVTYSAGVISIPEGKTGTLTATATFTKINYTVTMAQTGGASATLSDDQVNKHYGDEITVSTNEPEGYAFLGWTASPAVEFANAKALETTFTLPNGNVTVTAQFARLYTVAEALELASGTENVAIKGFVSKIQSIDPSKYQRAQYFISDDGTTNNQFLVYNGYYLDGEAFTSTSQLAVGHKVIVFGNIGEYNSFTQVAQNNYIVSLVEKGSIASIELAGTPTKTAYESGEEFEPAGMTVSAVYESGYKEQAAPGGIQWSYTPTFINESGDVSVTATYATMNDSKSVAVTVKTHAVTFADPANGSLVVKNGDDEITSGDAFVKGTTLTVEAEPASALYELTTLTAGGDDIKANKEFTIGTADVAVVATYTLKPFASLEALVAANLATQTPVVVSFSNVEITEFGLGEIFLNVKGSDEKNISLFEGDVIPDGWAVGGQVSGTAIQCKWIDATPEYNWYLNLTNGWTGITYKAPSGLAWSAETGKAYTVGKSYTLPSLSNPNSLTVTYSSSNTDAATINAETGSISIVAAGTTTIKATFAGNDDYIAKEVSYTLNVYAPTVVVTGTPKTAYESGEAFSFSGLGAKAVYGDESEYEIPDGGLAGWTANPMSVTADGQVQVYVTYATIQSQVRTFDVTVNKHAVTFAAPANGSLVVKNGDDEITSGDAFVKGTTLTVVATPADGYVLATLTAGETDIKESKSFTIGTADVTVAATFVPKYYLKNGWESGTWSWKEMTYVSENNYILENVVFGGEGVNYNTAASDEGATWVALANGEKFLGDAISAWDNVTLALNPSAGTITATLNSRASVEFGGSWTEDWGDGKITAVLSSDGTYATAKKELTKDVWYDFKPVIGGHWLGCSAGATPITRSSNTASGFVTKDGDNHIYFQADKTGEYQFIWYFITSTCQVTFPGDIPSALDNTADETKAVKFLENGQIFILRGDKVYTVDGQLVK